MHGNYRGKTGLLFFLFLGSFSYVNLLQARTLLGVDVLVREKFKPLEGKRVALITNQTGVNAHGVSTLDLLIKSRKCQVVCILTPEHGFRGVEAHGEKVKNTIDSQSGIPIYSLYGETTRPTASMLNNVEVIVFDIQDVGVRFYTYITTLGMALEEAAKRQIKFIVLDRPNPLRGDIIEGDILDSSIKRMTGYFSIPTRYGLTIGELASWYNDAYEIHADLTVIKMKNWKKTYWYDQTGLPFVPPSPNIPTIKSALLYAGIGCFEASNISVGRGTLTPFEVFGAPWINGKELCAYLRDQNYPGVLFEPIEFTPEKDIYQGKKCEGVKMMVTDRKNIRPFQIFISAFLYLRNKYPKDFHPEWGEIKIVTGSDLLKQLSEETLSLEEFNRQLNEAQNLYRIDVSPYYLY